MADNRDLAALTGNCAADEVTYSGDTSVVQLMRQVHVTGSEGAKTVNEVWFAEDTAHSSGHFGLQILGVRNDADAVTSGTDLDYTPLQTDAAGKLVVCTTTGLSRISVQVTGLSTVGNYSTNDQMGALISLTNASRSSGGTGVIRSIVLVDASDVIGSVDVVFHRASVTLAADNALYAISDADALNTVALVELVGQFDIGNNRICQAHNLAIPYDCSGGTTLYASLVTRSSSFLFGASTDLQLIVHVERN